MTALATFFKALVAWFLVRAIARMLIGAGITLVVYSYLDDQVEGFLNAVKTNFAHVAQVPLDILMIAGVGDALSILGSALMTMAAIRAASFVLGVKLS